MLNLKNIRAFIFDMDGTLIDSMRYWRRENKNFLDRHGYPVPEDLKDTLECVSSHAFARRFSAEHSEFTYEGMVAEYAAQMDRLYVTEVPEKPGAGEFLDYLREKGYITCVATATNRRVASNALAHQGFLEKLAFVTDDAESGMSKGNPRYFINLAARLGVKPEECVMFEDSAYAMKSAKQAGLTVFAIEEYVFLHEEETMKTIRETADLFVHDFYEAKAAMEEALAE